jgi:hypothetical protein
VETESLDMQRSEPAEVTIARTRTLLARSRATLETVNKRLGNSTADAQGPTTLIIETPSSRSAWRP